jgi:hypothetical protein
MKNAIFTSACLVLLFTSCKKEDVAAPIDNTVDAIQLQNTAVTSYISDWEPVPAAGWQASTSTNGKVDYSYTRSTPQLNAAALRGGMVKAFAKGYNFVDMTINTPQGLPFQFYLPYERMAHPYVWNMDKEQEAIKVGVSMDKSMSGMFIGAQNGIQMRYVVISPAYFTQNNTDAQSLSNMSYTQLMTKLGVNP